MANKVFANNMEVSCKAGSGKTICAFPDVCFTPPQTPATPPGVPIPYPNTGLSSDCNGGTGTVKISGQEAMLKDKSCFKKSSGDEAGSAPKKGIITSKIQGKVYFNSWSMDVKFEGENAVRHLDLTTHNHASKPGQTPPFPEVEGMAPPVQVDCEKVLFEYPVKPHSEQQKDCKALKQETGVEKQSHHVIQNSHFQKPRGTTIKAICPGYEENDAPCIALLDGTDVSTEHGRVSRMQKADAKRYRDRGKNPTYAEARQDAKNQLTEKKPGPGLKEEEAECILKEVDKYFEEKCGGTADKQLRPPGQRSAWKPDIKKAKKKVSI
ncbi:MAG: DUF4150 domain-containing protein [Pseudomonadota bacterium]|nr:DUF4150 domain-containing protein [Pseudomonadota bacterium]